MDPTSLLIAFVLVAGLYMSWNIGANDVANAIGTSVGSKALTMRKAVIMAAIFEFLGAFFLGSNVSETLQKGIVAPGAFIDEPMTFVLGMISALIATALWLQLASTFGWPVSTTHAIVGAILGFGLITVGFSGVRWIVILPIASSWIISPLLSAIAGYILFGFVQRRVLFSRYPVMRAKRSAPFLASLMVITFILGTGASKMEALPLLGCAILGSIVAFLAALFLVRLVVPSLAKRARSGCSDAKQLLALERAMVELKKASLGENEQELLSSLLIEAEMIRSRLMSRESLERNLESEYALVERIFAGLQIVSAAFVAFAHGANDVANAIGPVAAAIEILKNPAAITAQTSIPPWILIFGGFGIVLGVTTWGWRVIETIGKKITELSPTRGFAAEFGAAITILGATKLGLPISTTHCIVGAVLGVGMRRGFSALNLKTAGEIGISWAVTIPSSMLSSMLIFKILKFFF